MSQIVIVAKMKVKAEYLDEVYQELVTLYTATHANDAGCIQYDFHKDLEDNCSFSFVETWESALLLEKHMQKEHFLLFVEKCQDKLENLEINKLEKIKV